MDSRHTSLLDSRLMGEIDETQSTRLHTGTAGRAALAALSLGGCSLRGTRSTRSILCSTSVNNNRTVPENTPPGVNIGDPISATDADETGEGNDASSSATR